MTAWWIANVLHGRAARTHEPEGSIDRPADPDAIGNGRGIQETEVWKTDFPLQRGDERTSVTLTLLNLDDVLSTPLVRPVREDHSGRLQVRARGRPAATNRGRRNRSMSWKREAPIINFPCFQRVTVTKFDATIYCGGPR